VSEHDARNVRPMCLQRDRAWPCQRPASRALVAPASPSPRPATQRWSGRTYLHLYLHRHS